MKTIFLGFNIAHSSVSDFFLELANQLSGESKIVIISNNFQKDQFQISPDIKIINWPTGNLTGLKAFLFLYKAIKREQPDTMISVFGAVNPFLILGYFCGVKNRIAWCRSISKQFQVKKWILKRKRYIYELATIIFANSAATKNDLIENYGVNGKKISVFYNAVKNPLPGNRPIIINRLTYVGRMSPTKGVDTLLEALPLVIAKFPDVTLELIGGNIKGGEINMYKDKCMRLKIEKSVNFLGNKSKEVVINKFAQSYLTIVPSLVEAFGFVVIESFSVGTPVVGSNTTGIAEIIRDGEDGFLFAPQDHKDLAAKINLVLDDPQLRDEFSLNCHRRFLDKFELNKAILELKDKILQLNT